MRETPGGNLLRKGVLGKLPGGGKNPAALFLKSRRRWLVSSLLLRCQVLSGLGRKGPWLVQHFIVLLRSQVPGCLRP